MRKHPLNDATLLLGEEDVGIVPPLGHRKLLFSIKRRVNSPFPADFR